MRGRVKLCEREHLDFRGSPGGCAPGSRRQKMHAGGLMSSWNRAEDRARKAFIYQGEINNGQ